MSNERMQRIKAKIVYLMQQKSLTAAKFADLIGVQRATISHILSGRNNPSLEVIQKIMDTFQEVKPEWLFGEVEELPNGNSKITNDTNVNSNVWSNMFTNVSAKKKILRIVIFYDDQSFEVFET